MSAGPADDERYADRLLVGPALVDEVVFAPEVAVVAGVDDDGVVGDPKLVELLQEPADLAIQRRQGGAVVPVVHRRAVRGHRRGGFPGGGDPGVEFPRQVKVDVVVEAREVGRRQELVVHRLVGEVEAKRLSLPATR